MTIRHMSDIYETYIRTRVKKYNTKMEEIVRPQLTAGLSDVSSMICCKTPTITHCVIPTLTIVYLGGGLNTRIQETCDRSCCFYFLGYCLTVENVWSLAFSGVSWHCG